MNVNQILEEMNTAADEMIMVYPEMYGWPFILSILGLTLFISYKLAKHNPLTTNTRKDGGGS